MEKCSACNRTVAATARACPECGHVLPSGKLEAVIKQLPGLVVLVVFVVVGWWFVGR